MGIFRRRKPEHGATPSDEGGAGTGETGSGEADDTLEDEELVDPDERSPELGLKFKDLRVLGALVDHGADLTQPRHVLHYLYASDPAAAAPAAEAARSRGFQVTVDEPIPEHPGQWPIRCEKEDAVLSADVVRDDGNFFDELAARFGLEYDGWEASV